MSFSFRFSGDDIENDGQNEEQTGLVSEMLKHSISEHAAPNSETIEPSIHTLRELVSSRSFPKGYYKPFKILLVKNGVSDLFIDAVATRHRIRRQFWGASLESAVCITYSDNS